METQLDQARGSLSRQRGELDELRARLEDDRRRLDELLRQAGEEDGTRRQLQARLQELEEQRGAFAEALERRVQDVERATRGPTDRLEAIELRLRQLEEGSEISRVRMRLERVGHRLEDLDRRLGALEDTQASLQESVTRSAGHEQRLERLESLFEELAEELREHQDELGLDALRARMDDVETLVLRSATDEDARRQKLEAEIDRVRKLSETIPPPPPAGSPAAGPDLTRIRGIGPKYASLLRDAGITTFEQIAAWTDADIERVAGELGIKPSRIRRAGWVKSARKLVDPIEPKPSDPAASDPPASVPPASVPAASDPAASDPAASDPAASDPAASDPTNGSGETERNEAPAGS